MREAEWSWGWARCVICMRTFGFGMNANVCVVIWHGQREFVDNHECYILILFDNNLSLYAVHLNITKTRKRLIG